LDWLAYNLPQSDYSDYEIPYKSYSVTRNIQPIRFPSLKVNKIRSPTKKLSKYYGAVSLPKI
jgi:hypothetical protein